MPALALLLALNLHALDWTLSIRGGFFGAHRIGNEEPSIHSWEQHAPSGFPIDSIDSLAYHHDESYAIALEAEAGYRGFWLGACLGGGSGNGFVDDSAREVLGLINNNFNDAGLGIGYDLSSRWPFANAIGVFARAGHLWAETRYTYLKYVEATESCGDGIFYAGVGIRVRIPWALVSYLYPVSRDGMHRLLVSLGGNMLGEGEPPASAYFGAYYDQSWNSRDNLSTLGCLLSVFGPGR